MSKVQWSDNNRFIFLALFLRNRESKVPFCSTCSLHARSRVRGVGAKSNKVPSALDFIFVLWQLKL